jgi:hypothetical protein
MCEAAHLSSGIGVQGEAPFDAIGREAAAHAWLETPIREPGLCHVRGNEAR